MEGGREGGREGGEGGREGGREGGKQGEREGDYALGTYPGARRTNYLPIMAFDYRNAFASNSLSVCVC